MFISLSGVVWSFELAETFIFFTTGNPFGRKALSGNTKGNSIVKIKGVNIRLLTWGEGGVKNVLPDARCEFGDFNNPLIYSTDSSLSYNPSTCENITIGPLTELYCAFACESPQIPHEMCLYTGPYRLCPQDANFTSDKCDHRCREFVAECPRGKQDMEDVQGKCRPLLFFNVNVEFRLGKP